MNTKSKEEMRELLQDYCADVLDSNKIKIADIGSYDVNGTYKTIVPKCWQYTGVDIREGPNVDMVMKDEFVCPVRANTFDVVISGATLEHCTDPARLVKEMGRILKSGGLLIVNAPKDRPEHGTRIYPDAGYEDYWRFMPQGMELLVMLANLQLVRCYELKTKKRSYSMVVAFKK